MINGGSVVFEKHKKYLILDNGLIILPIKSVLSPGNARKMANIHKKQKVSFTEVFWSVWLLDIIVKISKFYVFRVQRGHIILRKFIDSGLPSIGIG